MTMALIPEPSGGLDYPVVDVCASIEVWAASTDDIAAIKATVHKLSAIDHYLEVTSTKGRSAVAATLRHLEVRIGDLLGPAEVGAHSSATEGADLSRHERTDFRQMAAHPEVVEEAITASSDEKPASRRAVLAAIRRQIADELREHNEAVDRMNAHAPEGFDPVRDKAEINRTFVLFDALKLIDEIDIGPAELAHLVRPQSVHRLDPLPRVRAWLDDFATEWSMP